MAITLYNVNLHQLKKDDEGDLVLFSRNQVLTHSLAIEAFINEIDLIYNAKAGKGFGQFAADSQVASLLGAHRKSSIDFLHFSSSCAEKLREELIRYPFADEGVIVFAEYRALATDYLFIGLLESKHSCQVTDDLEISDTDYLEVSKMDIAARIDLSTWESDPSSNRYLTYIKGRVGRKVADFFLDFMQANIGLDVKQQNRHLMQAVEEFCTESATEKQDQANLRSQVANYCNEQAKSGEEVVIKELAAQLPKNAAGQDFYQYASDQGYELEASFPADKPLVRQLTKLVGAGGGLSINFDSLLLGERIFYDEASDTLTIKGTPPNLRDQLKRRLNNELD